MVYSELVKSEDWNRADGVKKPSEAQFGVLRVPDKRWTVNRKEIREDPIPIRPWPSEGARIQRERITKQDIDEFGATVDCPGCNAIRDTKLAHAHSDNCRVRVEECSRTTPQGAERLDRNK